MPALSSGRATSESITIKLPDADSSALAVHSATTTSGELLPDELLAREWCSDWSDVTEYTPNEIVVVPQGPSYSAESKRVVGGGCLRDNPDSFSSESPPETRSRGIGFRVVAVLKDVTSP